MVKTVSKLVRIRLMAMLSSTLSFMRGKKSSGKGLTAGTTIVIAIVAIAFLAMMAFTFGMFTLLAFQMRMKDCEWLFFVLAAVSAFVFSLVGSAFAAQSYLFDATDNELLLSMPIPPSSVLLSRMLTLFVLNCIYSYLILIPVGISYGLFFHFTAVTAVLYILSLILIPALVTAFSCIFGYLLVLVSAKIPNKNMLVVAFGFIMIALLLLVGVNLGPLVSRLLTEIEVIAENFRHKLPPLYWYGKAMREGNVLYFLPMLLICTVPVILVFAFLSKKFTKIITRKTSQKKKKYVEKPLKPANIRVALIKKEIGYFFSIPGYVMNAGFSTVTAILLGISILLKGNEITDALTVLFPESASCFLPLTIGSALAMCCVMNDVTAPSISLEAKTLWILKSTPIKPMDIFIAKAMLAPIISLPGIIFTSFVSAVCLPMSVLDILFIIISPFLACIFSGLLGVCVNIKLPRFDWTAEITVIKQSMSVVITLLTAMFVTAIPFTVAILPAAYKDDWASVWPYSICIVYFILMIVLEISYLMTEGKKAFNKM